MPLKKKNIKTENRKNTRRTVAAQREKPRIASGKSQKSPSAKREKNAAASDLTGQTPTEKKRKSAVVPKKKTAVSGKSAETQSAGQKKTAAAAGKSGSVSKKKKTPAAEVISPQPAARKKSDGKRKSLPRIISTKEIRKPDEPLPETPENEEDLPDMEEELLEVGKKDSLKTYMENISRYPLISVEDEVRLAEMIHSPDQEQKKQAAQTLIQSNLRLVVKIAHDFKGIGLPLMDLISEGNIGLMRSVYKFDPALGAKFSSYAAWWIKQSMHRALSNQTRIIRIPVQTGAKIRKIRLTREKMTAELGREPLDTELAEELHYSKRTVNMLRHAESSTFSLNDPIKTGENDTFEELIADPNAKSPEKQVSDADSLQRLREALSLLDEREREVINLRFYRFKTLEQVSVIINRTRERVRQIQNQALAKMRTVMAEEAEVVNS